jgi:hypothetical protein
VYYRLREGSVATQLRSVLDAVERTMPTAS